MAHAGTDPSRRIAFGRAFLLELERGDLEQAQLYARAFLHETLPPGNAVPTGD